MICARGSTQRLRSNKPTSLLRVEVKVAPSNSNHLLSQSWAAPPGVRTSPRAGCARLDLRVVSQFDRGEYLRCHLYQQEPPCESREDRHRPSAQAQSMNPEAH